MRHIVTLFCGIAFAAGAASALTLNVTAGKLADHYAEFSNTTDNELVLEGTADVRDLSLLKYMSSTVTSIDMSKLDIKAYTYPSGDYMGRTSFEDGELPPYIMTGSAITQIKLPETLKIIGNSAFVSSHLKTIEFPPNLKRIDDYAFANADSLTSAHLQNNVTLGVGVFKDCDMLKEVVLDYSIDKIPASMFDGCSQFTGQIPSSVTEIGAYAYRGTALDSINIAKVKEIGNYAFADMPNLVAIIMNSSREAKIGVGAFFNDPALEIIPSFDSDMSNASFAHSGGITSGTVIDSKNIGIGAYANNSKLDTLYLGPNVSYIGSHAFRNTTGLKLVDVTRLKDNVPEVESDAFSGLENEDGKYDIELNVAQGNEKTWSDHEIWGKFKIGNYDVGVDDILADADVEISISKQGNTVNVSSNYNVDYVGIFALNGTTLYESHPLASGLSVDIPDADMVVVKVVCGDTTKIAKLK